MTEKIQEPQLKVLYVHTLKKMICENCDKPDATIKYKGHWLCSALCVGVFNLNQADPEVFKKLHQDMGITKKEDGLNAF